MKNEFLYQISNISHVLLHISKNDEYGESIHKQTNHYTRHIKSLTKELDRAMFTKSELDMISKISEMYLTWDTKEEKHLKAIKSKLKRLLKMARESRYERIK
tara:strand:+ start:195 stop:500 length:306 start_codon:yes stop_codon:yes gene_type:complete